LINRVQNLRKAKGLEITDRINIRLSSNPAFDDAIIENTEYISSQVLADELIISQGQFEDDVEIDDQPLTITITKK